MYALVICNTATNSLLQDNSIDAFPLAFLNVAFDTGGLPSINLANVRYL